MKYVGLLSGGKDSCFNLLHCHHNGHQLVATASLGPEHGKEEIDSYLYQTVGQDAIEFVAQALDVPLYRRTISGTAIEQGSEYGGRIAKDSGGILGDETEDLFSLLSTVKTRHPDIQGVSVGAILSNYQRVRVEHVCRRLGLTTLSYLWQRDQAELLSEMIKAGMEAIIIKVAGIGLAQKHLGKTLAEMQPTLVKLNEVYGSHICGEGGEYETLTLDCPLFKSRITLTNVETVIHSDNDFATVAYLRVKDAILEPKPVIQPPVTLPPLLEYDFLKIEDAVLKPTLDATPLEEHEVLNQPVVESRLLKSDKTSGSWASLVDIYSKVTEGSFEEEVECCFQILQDRLAAHSLNLSHCTNINIFLSSIDLFTRLNSVYAKFFGTSPPARACVAVDLIPPLRIKIDCIAYAETSAFDRRALHVQGLSYWAPANIGPYSQAIQVGEQVFISGQIGLIPSSLSLPSPPSLATEVALAFQHVDRVINAVKSTWGGWEGYIQLVLYWLVDPSDAPKLCRACETYTREANTPTLLVGVPALPKGAMIEKQVLLHTGRCLVQDDDEMVLQPRVPEFEQGRIAEDGLSAYYEISSFENSKDMCGIICVQSSEISLVSRLRTMPTIRRLLSHVLSVRLFYRSSQLSSAYEFCNLLFGTEQDPPPVTTISSRFIRTKTSDSWDYALCIFAK